MGDGGGVGWGGRVVHRFLSKLTQEHMVIKRDVWFCGYM